MKEVLQLQPMISEWENTYGFKALIVSSDRKEDLQRFIDKNKITATILQDSQGKVMKQYGVQAIPADFLINKEGLLEDSFVGWSGVGSLGKIEKWLQN